MCEFFDYFDVYGDQISLGTAVYLPVQMRTKTPPNAFMITTISLLRKTIPMNQFLRSTLFNFLAVVICITKVSIYTIFLR